MFDKKVSHPHEEVDCMDTLQTLVEIGRLAWLAALGRFQGAQGSLNDEKALGRSQRMGEGQAVPCSARRYVVRPRFIITIKSPSDQVSVVTEHD